MARPRRAAVPDAPPTRLAAGTVAMLAAMMVLPVMDGVAKHLQGDHSLIQVVWARYTFHLLAMTPLLLTRYGPAALLPKRLGEQLLRGGLLLSATTLFFAAIAILPLADTLALFFVSPLIVTLLAALALGEPVGPRRAVAVAVGFLGVLAIVRPGGGVFGPAALLALGAGTVHGLYMLATRRLAGSAPPLVTLFYTALLGAGVTSALVPFWWTPPSATEFGLMVSMGVLAATGHFLLIRAFEFAPAAWLAPLGYAEIVMTTAVGYVAFGDFPDAWTVVGIVVIVASGVTVSLLERRSYRTFRPGG